MRIFAGFGLIITGGLCLAVARIGHFAILNGYVVEVRRVGAAVCGIAAIALGATVLKTSPRLHKLR